MFLDGDGLWIVLVNGIGSENLRRSLDTMKVGPTGRPNNLRTLYKPNNSVFLWAAGMIEGFSTYFKIKQRTVLVLRKKSQYFIIPDHDFIHQNMNNRLILIYVMEQ